MNRTKFLADIDALRDTVDEEKVVELYTQAEELFEEHDELINDKNDDIKELKYEIIDLKEEVSGLEKEKFQLEGQARFHLEGIHDNIVTVATVDKFEQFLNQYSKL